MILVRRRVATGEHDARTPQRTNVGSFLANAAIGARDDNILAVKVELRRELPLCAVLCQPAVVELKRR